MVSHGLGVADAPVPAKHTQAGLSEGSIVPANPYLREYRHLAEPARAEERDQLEVTATDIEALTIDPERAPKPARTF